MACAVRRFTAIPTPNALIFLQIIKLLFGKPKIPHYLCDRIIRLLNTTLHNLKNHIMNPLKIVPLMACSLLWACQSQEADFPLQEDNSAPTIVNETAERQITQDVNSAEVDNILDLLFDNKAKSRAADYDIHVIKDCKGNDRIICINFSDNKGYALVSAVKSYEPILAYAETGHFSEADSLPLPVKAWMENTVDEIGESVTLPADSLAKIASKWRRFETQKSNIFSRADRVDPDHSKFYNLTPEEYQRLFQIMKPYVDSWVADGYRVYSVDDYNEPISIGDKFAVADYVQGRIIPCYFDDYWAVTVVRTKEVGTQSGAGHWMNVAWHQEGVFNKSFPLIPGTQDAHIPVGCGVVAIGQIMFAYKYPATFDWIAMPRYEGNDDVSLFLLDVYKKCKASYDGTGTKSYIPDRINALKGYGYSCGELSGNKLTTYNLAAGCPAILSGELSTSSGEKEDHAWIIEGAKIHEGWREVEIWTFTYSDTFTKIYSEQTDVQRSTLFYANWGYPDIKNNGYYGFSVMLPSNLSKYTSNKIYHATTNIKPNTL